MTIRVNDYVDTAFSSDDADMINPIIDQAVAENDIVIINFSGITFFTTMFFSSVITRFVFELGSEKYDQVFHVTGLTEVGKYAYEHTLGFAREESRCERSIEIHGRPPDES